MITVSSSANCFEYAIKINCILYIIKIVYTMVKMTKR